MSLSNEFKQLERKAYLSYHQDGLIDLLLGWTALAFGISMATDESFWLLLGWLPLSLFVPLKNRITVPRFGYVKFSTTRGGVNRRILSIIVLGVLVFFVLGTVVFTLSGTTPPPAMLWIRQNSLLFWAMLISFLFAMGGLLSGIRRLLVYALVSACLMVGASVLGLQESLPFLVLAGTILAVGAGLLIRFLRNYPLPPQEQSNAAG